MVLLTYTREYNHQLLCNLIANVYAKLLVEDNNRDLSKAKTIWIIYLYKKLRLLLLILKRSGVTCALLTDQHTTQS